MPIAKSPLSAVAEEDLQALISGAVREDRTLDFKRNTYGGNDEARGEFLADVSALANTLGGDLVLGMDEENGIATALPGLRSELDVDQEILRLTQIAQSGLQPRLPVMEMRAVPLTSGASALVIRVGRSYQGPHRVVFKGRNRFWARSSNGRYEPDVDELRELFSAAPQLAERLREMRAGRLAQILAGETPIPLADDPGIAVLHVIPLAAAAPTPRGVDFGKLQSHNGSGAWAPWGASHFNQRRNFDGFVTYAPTAHQKAKAYSQVFRSGMVEVAAAGILNLLEKRRIVYVDQVAYRLAHQTTNVTNALRDARVDPPYSVQFALVGMKGACITVDPDTGRFGQSSFPLERDVLSFVDTLVVEEDVTWGQVVVAIRPTLDQIYQTASCETCPWFDQKGKLKTP